MKRNNKMTRYFKWRVHTLHDEYAVEHLIELKIFINGPCMDRKTVIRDTEDHVYLSKDAANHEMCNYSSYEAFVKEHTLSEDHELIELSYEEFYKEITK